MIAAVPTTAVALMAMLLVAGAIATGTVAFRPAPARRVRRPRVATLDAGRVGLGIAVALVVLVVSRWPVLAVVSGALAAQWQHLLRDERADEERRRVEGIAKWLEDLRDTLRGSSVGTE